MTLLVVSSPFQKSGTVSGCVSTAARGAAADDDRTGPLAHDHVDVVVARRDRKPAADPRDPCAARRQLDRKNRVDRVLVVRRGLVGPPPVARAVARASSGRVCRAPARLAAPPARKRGPRPAARRRVDRQRERNERALLRLEERVLPAEREVRGSRGFWPAIAASASASTPALRAAGCRPRSAAVRASGVWAFCAAERRRSSTARRDQHRRPTPAAARAPSRVLSSASPQPD